MKISEDIAKVLMAGMKICPYCKKRINEKATVCPYCQKNVPIPKPKFEEPKSKEEMEKDARFEMGCTIVIAAVFIIGFTLILLIGNGIIDL